MEFLKMREINLFMKQKDSQTQKTNLQLPKGKGGKDKLGAWHYNIHTNHIENR